MNSQLLSMSHLILIIIAIICGTAARLLTLREDYRQYPTYPNGYLSHAVLGLVAAMLGAFFVPALMTKNFTAVTFLTLAITQFQGVRKLEQSSLELLEETEYTKRGNAYIDGIAKTFEARNYLALLVSLIVGIIMEAMKHQPEFLRIGGGLVGGLIVFLVLRHFSKGDNISSIATLKPGKVIIKNNELYVDDLFVSNRVGIGRGQEMLLKEGLAVILIPKMDHYRITLDNYGQRQAILFEITRSLGLKRYHFTRKDYEDGRIAFVVVPILKDINKMISSIAHTPLLESVQKKHKFLKKWDVEHE